MLVNFLHPCRLDNIMSLEFNYLYLPGYIQIKTEFTHMEGSPLKRSPHTGIEKLVIFLYKNWSILPGGSRNDSRPNAASYFMTWVQFSLIQIEQSW